MIKEVEIYISPAELHSEDVQRAAAARNLGIDAERIRTISLIRRTIDARRRGNPRYLLRFRVWLDQEAPAESSFSLALKDVRSAPPVLVVGAGPAGLFAALRLIEHGLRPVVVERGRAVRERRHDVAAVSKRGVVNPDSNYCFGEGGAGTFSDGKLYTRATKRGSTERTLQIFVSHGASADILIDSHPHIGTNKLPKVVSAISDTIRACGGELHFGERVNELVEQSRSIKGLRTISGTTFQASAVVLAAGHSARDIFALLHRQNITLQAKPFALGVRIEHPQGLVDELQYRQQPRHPNLPAASYALRTQVKERGVFSFCMCPGGVICPAATNESEVVVNGWSPSKRNTRFANSGIVVEISHEDLRAYADHGVWAGIRLQEEHEHRSFELGGGQLVAPAQRLGDILADRVSSDLPECSYNPGLRSIALKEVFTPAIYERLREALRDFNRARPGYVTNEAVAVATESRTSSPIRIPRDGETLMHPELTGLFPCGEGAGYAGGIMSAAMDGERAADAVARFVLGSGRQA